MAVLGYGFWQRQYGGDTSVIGKTVRVNQHPATVIGILPFDFVGLDPEHGELNEVWLPIEKITYFVNESKLLTSFDASNSGVHMFGRVKPGISFKAAEASLQPLAEELLRQHPDDLQKGERLAAEPGGYAVHMGPSDSEMLPLFGIFATLVLLVLAAACGNLGNLVLSRVISREREILIRLSLGAGRGRILRQLMTESFLLALLGGAAGLFLSWLISRPLIIWLGGPGVLPMSPDWRTTCLCVRRRRSCLRDVWLTIGAAGPAPLTPDLSRADHLHDVAVCRQLRPVDRLRITSSCSASCRDLRSRLRLRTYTCNQPSP